MRIRTATLLLLWGLLPAFLGGGSSRADEEVAAFLLEQAKRAVSKRDYDEAVVKLERALEEDPSLLEAAYVLGQVHEKRKDPGAALGAYRRFRDGCREGGEGLDGKLARLLKRAEKRIEALGKGERELEKLQAGFADEILRFARKARVDDPDIAADALRRLLAVAPEHEGARSLLREVAGESTGDAAVEGDLTGGAIPGITAWDDLLDRRAIPPGTNLQYRRGVMTIDQEGGTIFWTDPYVRAPSTFVYEVEFRFLEGYSPGYLLGLAFGLDEEVARTGAHELVMAIAQQSSVVLVQASGGRNIDVGESAVSAAPTGTWRRLAVAVQARKVRVFLDGEQVVHSSIPGRRELTGPIGIFHQRSQVEVRRLRLGTEE